MSIQTTRDFRRKLSIRARLALVILLAIVVVLSVAGAVIVHLDTKAIRQHTVQVTEQVTHVLKQDFIGVLQRDNADNRAMLLAKLQAFDSIHQAVLFDTRNNAVFRYSEPGGPVPTLVVPAPGIRFHDGFFTVAELIRDDSVDYGLIYLRVSDASLTENLSRYYSVLMALAPALVLVAMLIAIALQKSFTGPILRLRDTVNRISRDDEESLQIEPDGPSEMEQLYQGLNHMLDRIRTSREGIRAEKERLQITLQSIGDGVVCTDAKGRIEYINPEAERMLGYSSEEAKKLPITRIFNAVKEFNPEKRVDPATRCLTEGRAIGAEPNILMIGRDGDEIAISTSASPIWNTEEEVVGSVMVIRDVTEARQMARELSYQAIHDSLTGLINRREFELRIEKSVETAHSEKSEHVLIYMDLDQFKVVNDTCGHMAGDELLKQLSTVLSEAVRRGDTLARLGGDEFGILLENCGIRPARDIAEMLRQTVRSFRFIWEDKRFDLGASIGMVSITEESDNVMRLLSEADMACYAAKDAGRNRVWVYEPDDADAKQRYGEMQWVSRITQALQDDRFVLYRQIITPARQVGDFGSHYEVLVRMIDDDGSTIAPGAFLPAAERYNLSPTLDRWVVKHTLATLASRPEEIARLEMCSINLSGETLGDIGFLEFVMDQFNSTGVSPHKICFEITETSAIANLTSASRFISQLKDVGCRFALDDFGAGMSSFAYLKNLKVDFLKIDGMFIKDIVVDPIDFAMVKSINEIGHVMGMKTIAEFVESQDILSKLQQIGVDYAQGYGIGKPEPFSNAEPENDSRPAAAEPIQNAG